MGKVPNTAPNDLITARRLKSLKEEINEYFETSRTLFGHFFRDYGTDFQRIEKAIESATEILRLSWITPIPENLVQLVTLSFDPSTKIRQLGEELLESTEKWTELSNELSSLLSHNFITGKNNQPNQIYLLEIQDFAIQTEEKLSVLCRFTQEPLNTRNSEEPKNYKQLVDDLTTAECLRKKEDCFLAKKNNSK